MSVARGATVVSLRSSMPVSAAALSAWHGRPGAVERLTPGFLPALSRERRGPFAHWTHERLVESMPDGTSTLQDTVHIHVSPPVLGPLVAETVARDQFRRMLSWRHALVRADLERHATFAARGPRRVAVLGASGFLGSALAAFLRTGGHAVLTVGRGAGSDVRWDPARGELDANALAGVDAVIHLGGSSIAERWTPRARAAIRETRVQGTSLIARTIAAMPVKPEVFVCGSAVGVYGSRGDEWLDESSSFGTDYLGTVAAEWEAAAAPARDAGIRVVHPRTGIVLNPAGGALAKMLPAFRLGAGGRLGTGRQWMSWISREDWVGAVHHVMQVPSVRGPVNVVGPEPVTNATFTETLGRLLHRPTIAAVPAMALRALFGEMAEGTVLASQRARPAALEASGFRFLHQSLSSALRFELGLL